MAELTNSQASSNSSNDDGNFTLFSKFPAEIQHIVWSFAIPDPRVIILHNNLGPHAAHVPPVGMLGASHDSRKELVKSYKFLFCWLGPVLFHPRDTLLFSDISQLQIFLGGVRNNHITQADGQHVRFIALNVKYFTLQQPDRFSNSDGASYAHDIDQMGFVISQTMQLLGSLKEIMFLIPNIPDEDEVPITAAIALLIRGMESALTFSPNPSQWMAGRLPKIPRFPTLQCNLDAVGLKKVTEELVEKRKAFEQAE